MLYLRINKMAPLNVCVDPLNTSGVMCEYCLTDMFASIYKLRPILRNQRGGGSIFMIFDLEICSDIVL